MTVSSTANRISYAGNGVTLAFAFPYYFLQNVDLHVSLYEQSTGTSTNQVLGTDYTLTGAGIQAGGTVNMVVAPPTGFDLVIFRMPQATQLLDLVDNDPLPAEDVEKEFDKLTMLVQGIQDSLDRSIHISDSYPNTFDTELKTPYTPDTTLMYDSLGESIVSGPTANEIANAQTYALAAAASAAAALVSETNAATSETNAATSASNAATSETNAATSETNAATSAADAATSAQGLMWAAVVHKTFADSPITITNADRAKYYVIDATGGNVVVNLPLQSSLSFVAPFMVGIKKLDASGNSVTVNRAGSDTIDNAATSKVFDSEEESARFFADSALPNWQTELTGMAPANDDYFIHTFKFNANPNGYSMPISRIDCEFFAPFNCTLENVILSGYSSATNGNVDVGFDIKKGPVTSVFSNSPKLKFSSGVLTAHTLAIDAQGDYVNGGTAPVISDSSFSIGNFYIFSIESYTVNSGFATVNNIECSLVLKRI